ncbi:hypothetical protein [Clostridium peptidivorans]|uniref:hypothetical protein n=1 Tax=Clostridium peptidivorans TaxID=100174 RepID=UPI000BE247A0|nr:hypothetical protein [Clostridium peptidivorans]
MKIKRCISVILSLLVSISLCGCGLMSSKNKQSDEPVKEFDIKAAESIAENYVKYLMQEDYEKANKFYSKKLSKTTKTTEKQPLKIKGYNIEEVNEVGNSGTFKIKVIRSNETQPYASLDEYSIKVIHEEKEYKIDAIQSTSEKEARADKSQIRLKSKSNVESNLIIDTSGLPNYAFAKDDKAKTHKILVPKDNYGSMSFSFHGYDIAVTTYNDRYSFAGLVKIDESMPTQGGKGEQGGQGGQGGQGQGGAAAGAGGLREKPIGKEITPLDILENAKIDFLTFSADEKYILIQYTKKSGGKCIRLYTSEGGDLIPYEFEQNYPIDKVDIVYSCFCEGVLNYEVIPRTNSDKAIGKYIGRWQLDLKEFKPSKM